MQIITSNTDHKYHVIRTYNKGFFDDRNIDVKQFIGTFYGPYEIFDIVLSNDQSKYALISEIYDVEFELITKNDIEPTTWSEDEEIINEQ